VAGPARLPPVQRRAGPGGPALNGASHVLNDACHVRNRRPQLVTVSHLGSDHAWRV